ncbi:hypothetical protein [Nocardia fluminea]|uniref:Uncharacterized protein n=1 Tax=Nocardia fluminea TaxID=134984 RepID=A0A2N3VGY7_9NOCA|nr:hypothetical protein [Nocardia fluminea]PKV80874.1 hypothetical protein ATK86_5311 [Nocardia fluminea]
MANPFLPAWFQVPGEDPARHQPRPVVAEPADDSKLTIRLAPTETPARRIPIRFWPNPHTVILGHLTIGEPTTEGDLVRYDTTFTPGPLHGEKPVYDMRVTRKEGGRG